MLLRMGRLMEEYLFISSFERANKKKRERKEKRGEGKGNKKRGKKKETKQRTFDSLTIQWIPKWKRNRECRKKRKRERERKKNCILVSLSSMRSAYDQLFGRNEKKILGKSSHWRSIDRDRINFQPYSNCWTIPPLFRLYIYNSEYKLRYLAYE